MKKKKIGLVIPSLGPGGMERVMSILADYFDKKPQTEVHVILYGRNREIFYSISNSIVVHRPEFKFNNNKRTWHTIRTILFLRRCIKNIQADTLLSFGEFWNNLFLLSTIGIDIPKYVADRAEPGLKKSKLQEFLCRFLYKQSNKVIVQTEIARKIYEENYESLNIEVIGNPIEDLQQGKPHEKENVILSVGRLVDTKHFDLLVKIFARLKVSNWKLYIVGGNSQKQNGREKLERLIKKLGLQDKVTLTGTVSDIATYYRKSKIFAFTSSSEGFPNVIGEAMSAGLPVIAFDCIAGPSELIDDGENGYLIPLLDVDKFEEKLELLMKDDDLIQKMGEKSLKKINDFSIKVIAEKYYSLITEKI